MISKSTADTRMSVPTSRPSRRESRNDWTSNLGYRPLSHAARRPSWYKSGYNKNKTCTLSFFFPCRDLTDVNFIEHLLCYTLICMQVDTCTRSWKAIEIMPVPDPASESIVSLAWCSRTQRIRRGPSTADCTMKDVSRRSKYINAAGEYGPFGKWWSIITSRGQWQIIWHHWRGITKVEAKNYNKASKCRTSMNIKQWSHYGSPHTVTHVSC